MEQMGTLSNNLVRGQFIKASLIAIVGSIMGAVVGYLIFAELGAFPESVLAPPKDEPIKAMSVVPDSAFGALGASLVYAGFLTRSRQPVRQFRRLAMILLVLSFAYPLLIEGIPLKMFLALNALHIIVAVISVASLTIIAAPPERESD